VLRVRGRADRVDRLADGGLRVVDYKTGKPDSYRGLCAEEPVADGTCLQLPVYAHAARAVYAPSAATPTAAYYWFVGRGDNQQIGYVVDAAVDTIFMTAVRTIVEGVEAGVFVAIPPAPGPTPFVACKYCDPDALGTAERYRDWERKCDAPELAGLRSLAGDEEDE
jgi:RecB family exonuclease